MHRFRNIVTAFLLNEDKVLMLKRGDHKAIGPGKWFGVGGHIEPEEINDPYTAIYREIREETGLDRYTIENLDLKYIIYNHVGKEIVINHIFFGRTSLTEVTDSDEGTLHWIERSQAVERIEIPAVRKALEHYFSEVRDEILLGVVDGAEPYIWWYPL